MVRLEPHLPGSSVAYSADEFMDRDQEIEHSRQDEDAANADPHTPGCSVPTARGWRRDQPISGSHRLARGDQAAPGAALPSPQPYEDDCGHGREGRQLKMLTRRIGASKRYGHVRQDNSPTGSRCVDHLTTA